MLLTGYEPFGDFETNASAELARALDGAEVAGHAVHGEVLPVEFDAAAGAMADLVAEHEPAAVVATGLAGGRAAISVERVGLNVDDCVGVPDNAGAEPRDEPIDPEGPDARFATLPVSEAVEAMQDRGVPARLSNTAGTHLCNHLLYETVGLLEDRDPAVPAGFVHLPHVPDEAVRQSEEAAHGAAVPASMPLPLQVEGLRTVLEVAAE